MKIYTDDQADLVRFAWRKAEKIAQGLRLMVDTMEIEEGFRLTLEAQARELMEMIVDLPVED